MIGLGTDLKSFAAASNEFAVGLYRELRAGEGNLLFAPFSIRSVLALAYMGARGRTARQMAEVLILPEANEMLCRTLREFEEAVAFRTGKGAVEVDVASALWRQEGMPLAAPFQDMVCAAFESVIYEADFAGAPAAASRTINQWVSAKTRGRIPELFNPGSFGRMTRLVLANAVFFNGEWASPFPNSATHASTFYLWKGGPERIKTVEVPMMRREGEFGYAEFDGFEMLEMPYRANKFSMVVLLPAHADGWVDLEKELTVGTLAGWIRALHWGSVEVELPRFQIESSFKLEEALVRMGMGDAFLRESADFTGMTPEKPLGIGAVLHKAKAEVDEAGTRAAAATAITMVRCLKPAFRANRPFLFMIRDIPLDSILFMGRLLNPAE